jgi:hypothetical protein
LVLTGDAHQIFGYGTEAMRLLTGWEVELTDLVATIAKPTTTTTSTVTNSTTVPVTSGDGIMDDVSTVSGIGIDPSVKDPTVTTIGSYSGSSATLTLSAAQTLESGVTLTFNGAGETLTLSGNIEVKKAGHTSEALSFDLEKFITGTVETS